MSTEVFPNLDDVARDLEALLHEHRHHGRAAAAAAAALDRELELNIFRSGSAPPTVEGSTAAIRSLLMSDEDMRSNPNHSSYYYTNDNLNPRFRTASSVIGDSRRKVDGVGSGSARFSKQPGLARGMEEEEEEEEVKGWGNDGLIGLADVGLGARRKSFADTIQEDYVHSPPISRPPSRPISRNAYGIDDDRKGLSEAQFAQIHNSIHSVGGLRPGSTSHGLVRVHSLGSTMSQSFASAVGSSLSRSTTPDPKLIGPSSSLYPLVGERFMNVDKKLASNGFGDATSQMADSSDISVALSVLNLSNNIKANEENHVQGSESLYDLHNDPYQYFQQKIMNKPDSDSDPLHVPIIPSLAHNGFSKNNGVLKDVTLSALSSYGQMRLPEQLSTTNQSKTAAVMGLNNFAGPNDSFVSDVANIDFVGSYSNAYQTLPRMMNISLDEGVDMLSGSRQHLERSGSRVGSAFQVPIKDPVYAQHLQRVSDYTADVTDPSLGRSFLGTSHMDMSGYNKAHLEALLVQQRMPLGGSLGKSGGFNNGLYGNSEYGLHMAYPTLIPGNQLRQNDPLSRLPTSLRSRFGGSKGSWHHANGIIEQGFASTLLEEFKTNKTNSFELSEIADHVLEFSGDQYGSRFIQQKLETASIEEKNKLFPEILSHARVLMTDVFGNYVIQKFFEHGTESHRYQLASQLMGHVLPLSLQMYGCRVIQKALEVVDVDQQTQMVAELDGSIMKCVRDQNGNHVIQKCIECVPQERIQFVISSFYGQVVALSTHPYGCRVIQRVLEHCHDAETQSIMMAEIMQSVCTLAEDQYGNYVIQHVLQHGKQEERSSIIRKLAGQIVKMSQQKFASNVVEKCLTYGTSAERQLLINEMLGSTDENEPLQAMMKDQFANYVVQKILETCDDQNRELIRSRIKVHLNALKKYTYGKHIVARVEKLIVTGERHIGMQPYSS